jgi:hypothetical protein
MKLLVSLCNRGSWETAILGPFLVELSVASGEVRPIDLKVSWPTGTTGIMGLAHLGEDLLAVTQGPSALLLCLTRDYRLRSVWPLAQVRDAHSLAVRDGLVYVASTGTDRVIEFDLRRGSERVFWQANHHGNDSIHLNSLLWHRGELLATTFGPKKGDDWRSADDGSLLNLTTGQVVLGPLYHPHSVTVATGAGDGHLYFCESQRMAVGRDDGQRLRVGCTYTRGLVVSATHICVGFSRSRLTSRSRGAGACGWMPGACGVQIYQRQGDRLHNCVLVGSVNLEEYGEEIYDLLPV